VRALAIAPLHCRAAVRREENHGHRRRPDRVRASCTAACRGRFLGAAQELDAIDGTPILDIKPVMAEFLPAKVTPFDGVCRKGLGRFRPEKKPK
jgi:hypothetical protein